MQDESLGSAQESSAGDSSSVEASKDHDVVESDAERLHGALPPTGPSEDTATPKVVDSVKPCNPSVSLFRKAISRWGPYKRWNWYCRSMEMEKVGSSYWRESDPKENAQGVLPDGERVQVPVIWVVELYTPSTIDGLLRGITDLDWEYGRTRNNSLLKWMSDVRQGRTAGWTNLGIVSQPSSSDFMSERVAPLPRGIRSCRPILMSLTPSVTALVVAFFMDDESADQLNDPLRANYSTLVTRDPLFRRFDVIRYILQSKHPRLGQHIHRPDNLRHAAVRSRIAAMQDECVNWVRRHLPGTFHSLRTVPFPTALLFVTEKTLPLTEAAGLVRAFGPLCIDREYDAWDSSEWPAGRLVFPRSWDDEGAQLIFACRRHDAFPKDAGYPDPTSNGTIAFRADEVVRGLLSRWAVLHMLNSFHMRLASLRDKTARERKYHPIRDLKRFRALARTALYDILVAAQEVMEFVENDHAFRWEVMEMRYVRSVRGTHPKLIEDLRDSLRNRAQQIQRESTLLQATLTIITDVSQTILNTSIQRLLLFLAILSAGVALWTVFHK